MAMITEPTLEPPVDEQSFEQKEVAGLSQSQIVRRRFFRHKGAMISLTVLFAIIVLSVTSIGWGPIGGWWKWDPRGARVPNNPDFGPTLSLRPKFLGGSGIQFGDHPFGLDNEQADDLFAQTMLGIQTTFVIIIVVGILATVIGVLVGALSGYFGGIVDNVLMRITEVVIVIPALLIAAVAGFAFNASGMWTLAILLGVIGWTDLARLVRAEFLALREREFVDAARVAGASPWRIIFRHILPNSVGVIVVSATLLMGGAILVEAALGFLGFGVRAPDTSLGTLVNLYDGAFSTRPYLFVWPGFFIITIVLCIQFVGDGLRDAFDPRQKKIPKRKDLTDRDHGGIGDVAASRPMVVGPGGGGDGAHS